MRGAYFNKYQPFIVARPPTHPQQFLNVFTLICSKKAIDKDIDERQYIQVFVLQLFPSGGSGRC